MSQQGTPAGLRTPLNQARRIHGDHGKLDAGMYIVMPSRANLNIQQSPDSTPNLAWPTPAHGYENQGWYKGIATLANNNANVIERDHSPRVYQKIFWTPITPLSGQNCTPNNKNISM
jgi:hypothetical protein